jgi:hypothetical protein
MSAFFIISAQIDPKNGRGSYDEYIELVNPL